MIHLFFSCLLTNFTFVFFGKIFLHNNNNNNKTAEIINFAIFGTIYISFCSLLINLFAPLDKNINSIYIITILIFFFLKKFKITKKEIFFIFFSSLLTFFLIAYSNINRPDAGLYHLPFTQILNEHKIILGLSNLHSRFGHISIMQYLSASNLNYLTNINGILIPAASMASFIYIYFINQLRSAYIKTQIINYNSFFCLFVSIYIFYKIINYTNFGNDDIAHLLLFYLSSKFLLFTNKDKLHDIKKIITLCVYIFLHKITLIFCFIIPLYLIFKYKFTLKKIIFTFASFFLFLWFIKNILISSCLIYPIKQTCFSKLPWHNHQQILDSALEIEAWSKGWPNNKNKKINQSEFVKNFLWLKSWQKHLSKILEIIIPYIIFLIIILMATKINGKDKFDIKEKDRIFLLFFISLAGLLLFLLKFPIYRQGYSFIIIFLSTSFILLLRHKCNTNNVKKLFLFFPYIFIIIFFSKQTHRYIVYANERSLLPNIYSLHKDMDKNVVSPIVLTNGFTIYSSKSECMYAKSPCTNLNYDNINDKKIINYTILSAKK